MSEPKTVAKSIEEVAPGLFHYQIHDERINHISDGYAVVEGGSAVLVDPLPIEPALLDRLGPVGAIVIASPTHQRSALRYRRETGARVHAPEGIAGLDEAPDTFFRDGDRLPGGLRAVLAPGPKGPHCALYLDRGPGALLCADLFMHDPGEPVVLLPDKYLEDPAAARQSARRLGTLRFEVLCFGHGAPITRGGRKAIGDLVARQGKAGHRPRKAAKKKVAARATRRGSARTRTGAARKRRKAAKKR